MRRLALATLSESTEPAIASLAMLAGLTALGWRVQHFRSRARPLGATVFTQITGLPERHLDAWLMPPEVCREVFLRGCRHADLSIIEGSLLDAEGGAGSAAANRAGGLSSIRRALDLPTIGVLSCRQQADLHLPRTPPDIDGWLLDGLECPEEFESLRRLIPLLTRRPVLGAVTALRGVGSCQGAGNGNDALPAALIERLGRDFLRFADLPAIRSLAESRPWSFSQDDEPEILCERRFRVAYAQDEAFGGYYPDTLEMLESFGAELVEFSPLRSEALPRGVDLVMIGCGCPDRFADELAANVSLIASLKCHVCKGQRLYTEGGGAAYLWRYLVLGERRIPVAGILPFDAVLRVQPRAATPVSRTLGRDSWLGKKGTPVRGYRSGRWTLRPAPDPGDCPARSGPLTPQHDMYFRHHAIGSLIHLHLAALPQVVAAFAGLHRPSLCLPSRL